MYPHFHDAEIIYEKGEVKYKFVCRTKYVYMHSLVMELIINDTLC